MYICMCVYIYTENVNVFLQKRLGEAFGKVMVNISCWQSWWSNDGVMMGIWHDVYNLPRDMELGGAVPVIIGYKT